MRGKRENVVVGVHCGGLIPAYAGKTENGEVHGRCSWAHPRVCGENLFGFSDKQVDAGSSPRMRGKRKLVSKLWNHQGLIPAYAGKTKRQADLSRRDSAHPRVCGENYRENPC